MHASAPHVGSSQECGTLLDFADGILGFPEQHNFVLKPVVNSSAFRRLESLDDPRVAMYVCIPSAFFPTYDLALTEELRESLILDDGASPLVFCPVTFDPGGSLVYITLAGPFVANVATGRACQLVLVDRRSPVRAVVDLEFV